MLSINLKDKSMTLFLEITETMSALHVGVRRVFVICVTGEQGEYFIGLSFLFMNIFIYNFFLYS